MAGSHDQEDRPQGAGGGREFYAEQGGRVEAAQSVFRPRDGSAP